MTEPKQGSKLMIYYPLMLAGMLVFGIYLGAHYSGSGENAPASARFLPLPGYNKTNKIGQILEYIDNQYVDTILRDNLIDKAIGAILAELDPHSYYISLDEMARYTEPLEGNFDGIGVEFLLLEDTVRIVSAIEGGPSEKLGILAGDMIVSVEGSGIAGIGITNQEVMSMLRGKSGTVVNIDVKRRGQERLIPFRIERGKIPIYSVVTAQMTDETTGYIKVSRFARNTYEEFMAGAGELLESGMERLIIDLRGNGGGYMNAAISMTEEFLTKGQLIVYTEGKAQPRRSYYSSKTGRFSNLPVIVLINEGSASASEIFAGALQDNDRGIIVGRRSFGKGLVQEQLPLSDKSALRLTVARYYTPTGRSIQKPYGKGIEYDLDYEDRLAHGELMSIDSVRIADSLSYVTAGGKVVYGGGGIMPDVFVPIDTLGGSYFLSELSYSGVLNSFSYDFTSRNREALQAYGDYLSFRNGWKMSPDVARQLLEYAASKGIAEDAAGLKTSTFVIENRMKANIARNIWGNDGFYAIILDDDNVFKEAVKVFTGSLGSIP